MGNFVVARNSDSKSGGGQRTKDNSLHTVGRNPLSHLFRVNRAYQSEIRELISENELYHS